jgi:hypothetical protein
MRRLQQSQASGNPCFDSSDLRRSCDAQDQSHHQQEEGPNNDGDVQGCGVQPIATKSQHN